MEFTTLLAVCMSVVLWTQPTEVQAWGRSAIMGPGTYGIAGDPRIVITADPTEGYQPGYDYQAEPHSYPSFPNPETIVASGAEKPVYGGYHTGYLAGYPTAYSTIYPTADASELPAGYTIPVPLPTAHDPGTIVPATRPTPSYPAPVLPTIPPPASPSPAPQTPLPGDCKVAIAFSVCSLVGKVETFHYLKQKYEAPGTLPALDVKAKKHDSTQFAGRDECACKTAFHITASKNVTTKEDAKFYASNMQTMFETFVSKDDKFVCIDYGTAEYDGDGCPVAKDDAPAPPAVPATASASASATASATSTGGGPASATAISTGGKATAVATDTTSTSPILVPSPTTISAPSAGKCRVVKLFKLCVSDQSSFVKDVKSKQKELATMLGLKKKEFHKDVTFTDTTGTEEGFCAGDTALDALVSIPVATADEGNAMLQAVDSLASILIGQELPSVIGGVNGAPAVTQCV